MSGIGKEITTTFTRWARTVDYGSLFAVICLMIGGGFLILSATPAVAHRIGATSTLFIRKQVVFLVLSLFVVICISALPKHKLMKLSVFIGGLSLLATILTLVHGIDIKGARRWVGIGSFSIQPSEFLKPCLAMVSAWLLTRPHDPESKYKSISYYLLLALLCFFIFALLILQPDIGMLVVIATILTVQIFLAGVPLGRFLIVFFLAPIIGGITLYLFSPHVHTRINGFLYSDGGDHYQVQMALKAFANAGLQGRGPGVGHFKDLIPDAHADFIFAVAAEELGIIGCLGIIGIFAFISIRSLVRLSSKHDLFSMLAGTGLVTAFALQAIINMASTMHLIPTKGMTLPFMSYGGSSALAVGLTLGLLLGLTRNKLPHDITYKK